jgi:glycosyltransferase involved in cell wall biosynthesis
MGKKKILIITPFYYPNIGGAETFTNDLVSEIRKHHEVRVCTIDWGSNKTFKGVGIKQFLDVFPNLYLSARKAVQKYEFDEVWGIGLQSCVIAVLSKVKIKKCILLALYDFEKRPFWFKWICGSFLRKMEKVFVEGERGKKDILSLGIPSSKITTFQHWCDHEIFKPQKNYKNGWHFVVLFVGRPIHEKGKHIIQQVERELKDYKDMRFIYVENVKFENLTQYYQMADVVCVPSLYSEGIPRVVIESASCGCALIVSNRGTLPELVKDKGIGFCVGPTVEEFKQHILKLYQDRILLSSLREKAYQYSRIFYTNKNAEVFL